MGAFSVDSTYKGDLTDRPVRIAVWYPATTGNLKKMKFGNYVKAITTNDYFQKMNDIMTKYDMWSYSGMFNDDSVTLNRLMNHETNVYFEAEPVRKKFPLLVYSSGWFSTSPDNAFLAEFLASQGFIVATVPQLGAGSTNFDFKINEQRIQTQIDDLEFALEFTVRNFDVDTTQIVSFGFSTGGIVALGLSNIDDRIDAVIGLDGSYVFKESKAISKSFSTKLKQGLPILTFHRAHEKQISNVDYAFLESLQGQKRIIISIPEATHGEFSDEPFLFRSLGVPWLRQEYIDLKTAYSIHESVLDILDHFLKVLDRQKDKSYPNLELANLAKKYGYTIKIID